jgi:pimeloyl-ACP methyl ester carboxylesterase
MRFAQRFSEHVSSLVIADIAPIDYPTHSHAEIIAGMRAVRLQEVSSRRDADAQMAERIPNRAIRSFLLKNLVRTNDQYSWRLNIDAIESNYQEIRGYPEDGEPFDGPSFFIAGERSDYIDERAREAIAALAPNAGVSTISGAGHWLHAERQDEFVRRVREFLQEQ